MTHGEDVGIMFPIYIYIYIYIYMFGVPKDSRSIYICVYIYRNDKGSAFLLFPTEHREVSHESLLLNSITWGCIGRMEKKMEAILL